MSAEGGTEETAAVPAQKIFDRGRAFCALLRGRGGGPAQQAPVEVLLLVR